MSKIFLIALALIAGILAFMYLNPTEHEPAGPSEELLGTGKFIVEQNGQKIITEDFTLAYTKEEGYILISQAKLKQGGTSVTLAQQYQLQPDFSLSFYQLGVNTQSASYIVSAQPKGKQLHMEVRNNEQVHARDIPDRTDTFILDNNLVSQYQLLILAVEMEKLDRDFTAVVPQSLLTIPAHMNGPNKTEFNSGGNEYTGKRYTLKLGDITIIIITYKGRLAGLFNLSQGTIAYNATLFPTGISTNITKKATSSVSSVSNAVNKEVTFTSDGLTLSGTLTLPNNEGKPVPAVLMLGGSGPVDRDENMPGLHSNVIGYLAQILAKSGFASLRYDKRGVGKSEGNFKTASLTDLVSDAQAALSFLQSRPEIDSHRIFVLGHSEGGIIGPMIVANNPNIAGLILLAAPAHPLDYIIRHQIEELNRAAGKSDEEIQAALKQEDQYLNFVRNSHGEWSDYSFDKLKAAMPWLTQATYRQITATSLAWLREHFTHDPIATIKNVSCPVLIIQGKKDFQVPPAEADLLARALSEAGNKDVTVDIFPDLNHLMRYHPEKPNLTYRHLNSPLDPRVIKAVIGWLKDKTGV